MKKILFDLLSAQPDGTSKFHGGGEYIKVIFENMVKKYSDKIELIVFYDKNKFIDDWIIEIIDKNNIKVYDIKNIEGIKDIFITEEIDIFYSGLPYKLKHDYFPKNVIKVGTIHGLRSVEKPFDKYELLYQDNVINNLKNKIKSIIGYEKNIKENYSKIIDLLDKVICVSEHTKYSIYNYYPKMEKDIKVFYTPEKKLIPINEIKDENSQKYILILGGDRWIKNTYRAIMSIEGLYTDGKLGNYKIKIVGKLPKKIKKKINHIDKYELLNYVKPEELEVLYKNCDIFLYPTLNEGFGMPPLEAMRYGITCIVSGVTSLPEVCGNAVYYTNPYDIYEIRNRILTAIDNKISKNDIEKQLEKINNKQREDLDKVCEYIINAKV